MVNYPKPTALRLVEGNPGKRPLPEKEPKPQVTAEPPDWIQPDARKLWDEIAPKLAILGILTEIDLNAFARYCDALSHWLKLQEFISAKGTTYIVYKQIANPNREKGQPEKITVPKSAAAWPQARMYKEFSELLLRYEMQFGMTPSVRSRLQVQSPELKLRGYGTSEDDLDRD